MEPNLAKGPVIEFCNVAYTLPNGQQLLSRLNLQVQRGETLVLLGRSGSGKTTTLKLVNRLLNPTSGVVRVNGAPTAESDVIRLRRSIGYVIQDVGLFPHFTVERNIGLVPRIEGWPTERIHRRVEELLQMVGLEKQMASRYPHQLSGGQRPVSYTHLDVYKRQGQRRAGYGADRNRQNAGVSDPDHRNAAARTVAESPRACLLYTSRCV